MNRNIETGKAGEEKGIAWLVQNGFVVRERNWKHGRTEIDVIATKNGQLHLIEIKTRTGDTYGFPEEKISANKLRRIAEAGDEYLQLHPEYKEFIIDALSITLHTSKTAEYFLIEDIRP